MNQDELKAHLAEIAPSDIFGEMSVDEVKKEMSTSPERTIIVDENNQKQD